MQIFKWCKESLPDIERAKCAKKFARDIKLGSELFWGYSGLHALEVKVRRGMYKISRTLTLMGEQEKLYLLYANPINFTLLVPARCSKSTTNAIMHELPSTSALAALT